MRNLEDNILLFILVLMSHFAYAQCANPVTDAGLLCNTDAPQYAAPILCDLDCLNGFTATMPDTTYGEDVPERLCNDMIVVNNLSWFAFVAGSTNVDLTITPSNCTQEYDVLGNALPNTIGIQAGIYKECIFTPENSIVCYTNCESNMEEPATLSSLDLEIGKTYYIYIDGCGGSICDYMVTVNAGDQAFDLPDFTNITNEYLYDLPNDTICQGAEIDFQVDDYSYDVTFQWAIDPPTSNYPSGFHPVTDTNTVTFVFADEGDFNLVVWAYNDCDQTEKDTIPIVVRSLIDEVFTEIDMCQECLADGISLVTPDNGCIMPMGNTLIITEDPNGDGVPGWMGTDKINTPGVTTYVVTNSQQCTYSQSVTINEIPLSPRFPIDLYYCVDEFPVTYNGIQFNNPGDIQNITIENSAVSGCDSLQQITVRSMDIVAQTNLGNCENGSVELKLDILLISPTDYDSLTYEWKDGMGNIIIDDNKDGILSVNQAGMYNVMVSIHKNGSHCTQTYGPFNVDIDNLSPASPDIGFYPQAVCQSQGYATIYANSQSLGETYTWQLTPNLPFQMGSTTDTIIVDISSGQDFMFCVDAKNGCGQSSAICNDVKVVPAPIASFDVVDEVCMDSIFEIVYTGTGGEELTSEFTWDFGGGIVANSTDLSSKGPFDVRFSSGGMYDISVLLKEAGCESQLFKKSISVVEPFEAPMMDCESLAGAVLFTIPSLDGVTSLGVNVITGQSYQNTSMDSFLISNLGTEEMVEVMFIFNEDHSCGGDTLTLGCTSLPCPDVNLDIALDQQNICLDEDTPDVNFSSNIQGDQSGIGIWNSSPFINPNNSFDVQAAGIGAHQLTYIYSVNGCEFKKDTTINIFKQPDYSTIVIPAYCDEEGDNQLKVFADSTYIVSIDGNPVLNVDPVVFDKDSVLVTVETSEGCLISSWAYAPPEAKIDYMIDGEFEVIIGNSSTYTVIKTDTLPNEIYIWSIDGVEICRDCEQVTISPTQDVTLCLDVEYSEMCEYQVCKEIASKKKSEIYIANAFSPNLDGINDRLLLVPNHPDIEVNSFRIYDRFGELMYVSQGAFAYNVDTSWDGSYNNSPCQPGVYVYVLEFVDVGGNTITEYGSVSIIR